jgi:dienelactone hydrolase
MAIRRLFYLMALVALLAGCAGRTARALPSPVALTSSPAPTAPPSGNAALSTEAPAIAPPPTAVVASTATPTVVPTALSATAIATPDLTQGGTAMPQGDKGAATLTPILAGATATDDLAASEGSQGAGGPGSDASATPTAGPAGTRTATPAPQTVAPGAEAERGRTPMPTGTAIPAGQYPLAIPVERQRAYPGSEITFEQTLVPGVNYARYIVSYRSDGFKIYALMTVPNGPKPATGWPVVIFNHGSIPPAQYVTTERYVAYQDAFARAGYISFKSDYRGHGKSEGPARSNFSSADYTADVLNALTSLKNYKDADPKRIGMWGHSMGGQITLRAMVISKDIKAGVIWSGTVASQVYELTHPRHPTLGPTATPGPLTGRGGRGQMLAQYGTPEQNPAFWNSISPNSYLADLSGPLQLHHGLADETVPPIYSDLLKAEVIAAGKQVELYTYPGNDHNISASFNTAMARSVAFMDKYVKGN